MNLLFVGIILFQSLKRGLQRTGRSYGGESDYSTLCIYVRPVPGLPPSRLQARVSRRFSVVSRIVVGGQLLATSDCAIPTRWVPSVGPGPCVLPLPNFQEVAREGDGSAAVVTALAAAHRVQRRGGSVARGGNHAHFRGRGLAGRRRRQRGGVHGQLSATGPRLQGTVQLLQFLLSRRTNKNSIWLLNDRIVACFALIYPHWLPGRKTHKLLTRS